uniref:Mos1 transposase HTH domain-containing protein n=1 Tax=Globodera rostochiensis TaxID=31243 RepID=A0A914HY83_GLORO
MDPQVDKNEHFRHLFLFEFNKGSKASEASQNICAVYGEGATNERTAQRWSLSNALSGVTFENAAALQNWLDQFFASKPPIFYKRGIEKLPVPWEEIVNNAGNTSLTD